MRRPTTPLLYVLLASRVSSFMSPTIHNSRTHRRSGDAQRCPSTALLSERRRRRPQRENDDGWQQSVDGPAKEYVREYDDPPDVYFNDVGSLDRSAVDRGTAPPPIRRSTSQPRADDGYDDDVDDYDDDDENDFVELDDGNYQDEPGNFWANPAPGRMDDTLPPRRTNNNGRSSRSRPKTTFRSGAPAPPAPVLDLYNRLFWYGLDPAAAGVDDDDSDGDDDTRTMFGGTKGKFNGLSYLHENSGVVPDGERRQRRYEKDETAARRRRDRGDENYDTDADPYNYSDDVSDETGGSERRRRRGGGGSDDHTERSGPAAPPPYAVPVTPPHDPPRLRRRDVEARANQDRTSRRPNDGGRPRRRPPDRGDWVANTVASWFGPDDDNAGKGSAHDDDDDDDDDENGGGSEPRRRSGHRRRGRPRENEWSPWTALDAFLGLDRAELQSQAAAYDTQIGRNAHRSRRRSTPASSEEEIRRRRRPPPRGSTYRYDDEEDDESRATSSFASEQGIFDSNGVIDTEPIVDADADRSPNKNGAGANSVPPMTWQERSLAVERVPPAGIPAWGPTGDLGVDARTKALSDAVVDVQTAKRHVEDLNRNVATIKDEIAVLRVDAELERRRLRARGSGGGGDNRRLTPRQVNEQIRRVDRQVDDAARRLRYEQMLLDGAADELADVEARHWALLSFYDPHQAEAVVAEALRELEENEPAVRRYRDKVSEGDASVPGDGTG